MRVGLLLGKQGEDPGGLSGSLREWVVQPEYSQWVVEVCCPLAFAAGQFGSHRQDILLFDDMLIPAGPWLETWLGNGGGVVVAVSGPRLESYRALAEQFPVSWVPMQPSPECLGYAVLSALADRRRQLNLRMQVEQLQQRLNDRIVIERAKGILVQRLGITEEDAYKRLRVLSRRQRRQIRDIAQSLLDTQSLLLPDSNGHLTNLWEPESSEPERQLPLA